MLPESLILIYATRACLHRIQSFLQIPEASLRKDASTKPNTLVEIKASTLKWSDATSFSLSRLDFILKNGICGIVGKVGSGKSCLISGILGDAWIEGTGVIKCIESDRIGYVSQIPIVFSGTVRENIVMGLDWDPQKFDYSLKFAALSEDVKLLPHADLTIIGERGVTLSGGQNLVEPHITYM